MKITIDDIVLKYYENSDLEDFVLLFTNEELCRFMAGGAFDKEKDAENLFYFLKELSETDSLKKAYGIFIDDELIGHFETEKKENEIEIVYLLKKEFWGKGIMFKIINNFNQNNVEKLVARIMINNTNSTKMLEKLGVLSKKTTKFNGETVLKYTLKK